MKKLLLSSVFALMTCLSMWAVVDGQTYEAVNDIKVANQWIFDRVHAGKAYTDHPICHTNARTAAMDQGVIYVARSQERAVILASGDTVAQAVIHRFNVEDGSELEDLPLTLDGRPYDRFLGATSIGFDHFHHLVLAPMTSTAAQTVPVYMVDTETGELTLMLEMDKGPDPQRTDYIDVMGDITREEAECNVMTILHNSNSPGFPTVLRQHSDQGGEWEGGFEGDAYMDILDFYPEGKTGFSLAPIVKMCLDNEDEDSRYAAQLYYVDCFDSDPVLYDVDGTLLDTFEEAPDECKQTDKGANGVAEFQLEGRNFIAYPKSQYDKAGNGCQIYVCELGEGMTFSGMQRYWQLPADSVGKMTDGGTRVHCINTELSYDDDGNEVITLFTFKCNNGMAVYKIGKNVEGGTPQPQYDPCDVNHDGTVNVTDVNLCVSDVLTKTFNADHDVSGDNEISVTDINLIVSYILTHN